MAPGRSRRAVSRGPRSDLMIGATVCDPPPAIEPADLAAEVHSLAQAVHDLRNHPGNAADPGDLVRRIACLEVRARELTTDDLSRWLENLRELLEPAR